MVRTGEPAPAITTLSDEGQAVSLSSFRGKTVVLFFYPKADTPGCTIEACGFRDHYDRFQRAGIVLLGISHDTVDDQRRFRWKHGLPFTLLTDPDLKAARAYGAVQEQLRDGRTEPGIRRSTFVIGPDGTVLRVFPDVTPEGHADEVLEACRSPGPAVTR